MFAQRRLQAFLDDLAPTLGDEKGRDLLSRLNDKRVEQALPAEMELALLWALSRLGDLDVEPEWWGDARRPDAYTEHLIVGHPAAIEIAAPNDNSLSGEEAMDRIALLLSKQANTYKKGVGDYLYYHFYEERGSSSGRYYRRRLAPSAYTPSKRAKESIQKWIISGDCDRKRLFISENGLAVDVEKKKYKQTRYHNIGSSMPPETHSLDDNPLFDLLKRKLKQLSAAVPGTFRLIFLADVGSTLLNRIGRVGEADPIGMRVSGSQIISHFLSMHHERVDGIVVFAPRRDLGWPYENQAKWSVTGFGTQRMQGIATTLNELASFLPAPRFEGYQARSLFRQGVFSPKGRGSYLGLTFEGDMDGNRRIKIPSRLILDFLAGRIDEKTLRYHMGDKDAGGSSDIKHWLDEGLTISLVEMSPRNIDEDDDHIIFHFQDDAAARKLRLGSAATKNSRKPA